MLLVIDVGNTNTVLGVYDGQRLAARMAASMTASRLRTWSGSGTKKFGAARAAPNDSGGSGGTGKILRESPVPLYRGMLEAISECARGPKNRRQGSRSPPPAMKIRRATRASGVPPFLRVARVEVAQVRTGTRQRPAMTIE